MLVPREGQLLSSLNDGNDVLSQASHLSHAIPASSTVSCVLGSALMRLSQLELKNFRTFRHAVLDGIPQFVLLVAPNGRGKSTILEAIAGAHDLIAPYHQDHYYSHATWQQRNVPTWPTHLAPPVRIGERHADIRITVEATGNEIQYLRDSGHTSTSASAHISIEDGIHVTRLEVDEALKKLFRYHNPREGVGFVDYIRPIRYYLNRSIGNFSNDMSDDRTKHVFTELYAPLNQYGKFDSLKSFIVSSQLDDFSRTQSTGIPHDSLLPFRKVFNTFFSPKQLVGYRVADGGGEAQIIVESPYGDHDINVLSNGEKEILHQLAHLFRFRSLHNIVLWDTPELHLNASLESRLYEAIRTVTPQSQSWIATHSLELINSVPLESIFAIRQSGDTAVIERASGDAKRAKTAAYVELGAQVGLQLVSSVVAFVEGKNANSDKKHLDRLLGSQLPGVSFVAGESCENILAAGSKANLLLEEATSNGDFLAIVDRDYRTLEEAVRVEGDYKGRVFVWRVHEIENLFLDPSVATETLRHLGRVESSATEQRIVEELRTAALNLRDWISADAVASDIEKQLFRQARRISGHDPKGSLFAYAASVREKLGVLLNEAAMEREVDSRMSARRDWVEGELQSGTFLLSLPGKELLKKWLQDCYHGLPPDVYVDAAVGTILAKQLVIPELRRLIDILRKT